MHALMSSPEHVFTRAELIESALDYQYEGMERSLDTHVKNLRKKIEPTRKVRTISKRFTASAIVWEAGNVDELSVGALELRL